MHRNRKNLLITDPYTPQSYDVIRSLKSICKRIIVTVPPLGRFSKVFCFTANSRLVSKIYHLKNKSCSNSQEILFGKQDGKLNIEQNYIKEVLNICKYEEINLIYPTNDDEVVLLSKYKKYFEDLGIIIPVNECEVLKNILDKFNIVNLAKKEGILVPETHLLNEEILHNKDAEWFKSQKIIKPRFGNAANDVYLIKTKKDLERFIIDKNTDLEKFIIQEYIPGDKIIYYRIYMKRNGEPLATSCVACQRPEMLIYQSRGLVLRKEKEPLFSENIISLFRSQNYIGYGHAQFKVDSEERVPKLMEINARISRGTWSEVRTGLNGPLVSLCLFEELSVSSFNIRDTSNIIFIWPIQDLIIILMYFAFFIINKYNAIFSIRLHEKRPITPKPKEICMHYKEIYFNARLKKVFDNYFRYFFSDTLVSLCYWASFGYYTLNRFKRHNVAGYF